MPLLPEELARLEESVAGMLKKASATLVREWQHRKNVSLKALREPVTVFDVKVEEEIQAQLAKLLPEAGFILEEGADIEEGEYRWVVDPIDQTKNFIASIPLFYTQVALVRAGEPVLGVIYNPVSEQLFSASLGNGAKVNGVAVIADVKDSLEEALVDVDFGGNDKHLDWKMGVLGRIAKAAYRIRITGGSFLPYIATGGIDASLVLNEKSKIVDQMPGIILAREAGLTAEVIDVGGRTLYLRGSPHVFQEIQDLLSA
jgi:fructose-1,6-bisphosphatase/inositol monophosphatase family enzyme